MAATSQNSSPLEPGQRSARPRNIRRTAAAKDGHYEEDVTSSRSSVGRGIQNARRIDEKADSLHEAKTVSGQFEKKESIPARSRQEKVRSSRKRSFPRDAPSSRRGSLPITVDKNSAGLEKFISRVFKDSAFGKWMGFSIAYSIYWWQLLFSVLALVFLYVEALVAYFQEDTLIGKGLSFFVDLENLFPGDKVGYFFMFLNLLLLGGAFFVFSAFYKLLGKSPFGTTPRFLTTTVLFTFSVFPPLSLLPWILVWVFYMNILKPEKT